MAHQWRCCPSIFTQRREAAQCGGRSGLRRLLPKPRLCVWGTGEESLLGEFGFPKPIRGLPESQVQKSSPTLLPDHLPDNQGVLSISVPRYQFQTNIAEFTGLHFVLTQMILLLVCIHYSALILYLESRTCQAHFKACFNFLRGTNQENFIHLKVTV